MKRRTVLAAAATATASLAGCLSDETGSTGDGAGDDGTDASANDSDGSSGGGADGGSNGGTDGDSNGGADGDSDDGSGDGSDESATNDGDGGGSGGSAGADDCSDCEPPEIVDSTVRTTGRDCGSQDTDEASMDLDGSAVVLAGTLSASTPCHDAVLAGASVEDGTLSVRVDVSDQDGMCQQCIGEISYEATVELSGVEGLQSVEVAHAGGGEYSFDA